MNEPDINARTFESSPGFAWGRSGLSRSFRLFAVDAIAAGYSHVTQAASELIKASDEDIRNVLAASASEARGSS